MIAESRRVAYSFWSVFTLVCMLLGLAGCGGGTASTSSDPGPTGPQVNSIAVGLSQTSVKSDGSNSTTITFTALNSGNAAVASAPISLTATTGVLSSGSVTTDSAGQATVTFNAGVSNPTSRTATITAVSGSASEQIPIRISGSSVQVGSTTTSLAVGGATATLTVTVRDASNVIVPNTAVSFSAAGTGAVSFSSSAGTTNSSGQFTTTVTGTAAGNVTVTVSAVGETASQAYTIAAGSSSAFGIIVPTSKVVSTTISTPLTITVQAPSPTTSVTFVTTLGTWNVSGTSTRTVAVGGGTASANLTLSSAGIATVQVFDTNNPSTSDTMTVTATASVSSANAITIQATPTVVAQSSGTSTGLSTLIATVVDSSNNPVGGAPVAFEIIQGVAGGETVSPAVALTASTAGNGLSLGQAKATFTSGSRPSGPGGVKVRASVVGTSVATGPSSAPSGNDASLTIGGTAGSVTIGRGSSITSTDSDTTYTLPMSVLVADSNGNPVTGAQVSLSSWPIAFNADGASCTLSVVSAGPPIVLGDYYNEDVDEDLTLDAGEDGVRYHYPDQVPGVGTPTTNGPNGATTTTSDSQLTAPNTASGTLPATVTTNSTGVATFNLVYTKSNAIWVIARIRASVIVQGTETVGQTIFRLPALDADIDPCHLPDSPYFF